MLGRIAAFTSARYWKTDESGIRRGIFLFGKMIAVIGRCIFVYGLILVIVLGFVVPGLLMVASYGIGPITIYFIIMDAIARALMRLGGGAKIMDDASLSDSL